MSEQSLTTLVNEFASLLGADAVLGPDTVRTRRVGLGAGTPVDSDWLVRPASTDELQSVLRACHAAHQPLMLMGGLTGLVGSMEQGKGLLGLSLERMNRIIDLDVAGQTLTVEAGVTLQQAQDAAAAEGLMLPVDLGARGSCTLGGNAACNAGGNMVLRYGMTRDSVLGLEAVLADGTCVSSLNRMLKNNAGYDLKQLFIGTEGTLGVITKLVLRLRPAPRSQQTALLACADFDAVIDALRSLESGLGGTLSAFEVLWNNYYTLVTDGARPPLDAGEPYYILIEAQGPDPVRDGERFESVVADLWDRDVISDAVVAKSDSERQALWQLRDDVDKCTRFGRSHVFDVSLPVSDMESYVNTVLANIKTQWPEHHAYVFGHVGDGNLHFLITVPDDSDEAAHAVEAAVYEPLRPLSGSISGEHGIGTIKKGWLGVSRSPEEIALMRSLKQALDPRGILNPGLVVD